MTPKQVCRSVCDKAARVGFVDPVSGLPPWDEVSLSALLSLYHQDERIDWGSVPFLLPSGGPSGVTAATILGRRGFLCTEYPLFWDTPDQLEARGQMTPDFLFLGADRELVALIEHKIGSGLTHRGDAFGGQLGRYAKYLAESSIADAFVILLTSEAFIRRKPAWYVTELDDAARGCLPEGRVQALVMTWEDVLRSFRGGGASNPPLQPTGSAGG